MSDHSEDFVSFEKALRDLNLRSEELKKLVSEGDSPLWSNPGPAPPTGSAPSNC